ncbi:MAG: UbiA-like polyprenyltransferase [Saprospiraceae bacterium]
MKNYLALVKFSHTIFALPFALAGFFIGVNTQGQSFQWTTLLLVLLCMVFARNAAMAFNRLLDRDIDAKNSRTAVREIPAGLLTANSVFLFVIFNSLAFITTTYFINSLCFYLSPIALLVVLGYSYTKRFTAFCHIVLGIGLALAPIGAYLAVTGQFNILPVLLGIVVLFWVAGFDIIYALQDFDFDTAHSLHSTPVWLGKSRALGLSTTFHVFTAGILILVAYLMSQQFNDIGFLSWSGVAVFVALLIYQHTLVKINDLSKINLAFFTTNGIASFIFGVLLIADFYF